MVTRFDPAKSTYNNPATGTLDLPVINIPEKKVKENVDKTRPTRVPVIRKKPQDKPVTPEAKQPIKRQAEQVTKQPAKPTDATPPKTEAPKPVSYTHLTLPTKRIV